MGGRSSWIPPWRYSTSLGETCVGDRPALLLTAAGSGPGPAAPQPVQPQPGPRPGRLAAGGRPRPAEPDPHRGDRLLRLHPAPLRPAGPGPPLRPVVAAARGGLPPGIAGSGPAAGFAGGSGRAVRRSRSSWADRRTRSRRDASSCSRCPCRPIIFEVYSLGLPRLAEPESRQYPLFLFSTVSALQEERLSLPDGFKVLACRIPWSLKRGHSACR